MKNNKVNYFDQMVQSFVNAILSTGKHSMLYEDEDTKTLAFDILCASAVDIDSYSKLITNAVLPTIDKEINNAVIDFNKSQFKTTGTKINVIGIMKENKPEFIRQAYVIAFHKFEVYSKRLKSALEITWQKLDFSDKTFDSFCSEKYNLRVGEFWYKFPFLHTLSFISNTMKHSGGYPILDNKKHKKPNEFQSADENEKIVRTAKEFTADMKQLSEFTVEYFRLFTNIQSYESFCTSLQEYRRLNEEGKEINYTSFSNDEINALLLKVEGLKLEMISCFNRNIYTEFVPVI